MQDRHLQAHQKFSFQTFSLQIPAHLYFPHKFDCISSPNLIARPPPRWPFPFIRLESGYLIKMEPGHVVNIVLQTGNLFSAKAAHQFVLVHQVDTRTGAGLFQLEA